MKNQCPCGSKLSYLACCGPYIEAGEQAKTPEALMRSRYTAYTQGNISYIKNTMRNEALVGFDELAAATWAKQVSWMGLEVTRTHLEPSGEKGYVEFIARFKDERGYQKIAELSEFEFHQGRWFYTKAAPQTTSKNTARNALCPCGSQRKFKNCHG